MFFYLTMIAFKVFFMLLFLGKEGSVLVWIYRILSKEYCIQIFKMYLWPNL